MASPDASGHVVESAAYPVHRFCVTATLARMERTVWRPFTVPNLLSLVRLACVPVFVWVLFDQEKRFEAALLLAALGATDWVDGWVARRFDQVSELGKLLDPTADRIMMLTAIISVWIDGSVPAWFAIATLVREALVTVAALVLGAMGAERFDVTWWGKTGTFLLMFAYPLLLGGASDVGAADVLTVLGWLCGIPGLLIAWYAAAEYVPIAREALDAGRRSRV